LHALIGSQVHTDALSFTRRTSVAAFPIETDHREVARQTTNRGLADEAAAARHEHDSGRVATCHTHRLGSSDGATNRTITAMMNAASNSIQTSAQTPIPPQHAMPPPIVA